MQASSRIAVLGASGLIGCTVAETLLRDGHPVTAVARAFSRAQAGTFGPHAAVEPIAQLDVAALGALLSRYEVDIVLNCVGVLQDRSRGETADVHAGLLGRLLQAIAMQSRPVLLIHVSVPGRPEEDATAFSRTKRDAERLIESSQVSS